MEGRVEFFERFELSQKFQTHVLYASLQKIFTSVLTFVQKE